MWSVSVGKIDNDNESLKPQVIISYEDAKMKSGVDYIADPFLMKKEGGYYLFVEAAINNIGRIDVFFSLNLQSWKFEGIALEKDFHLSYPFVFQNNGYVFQEKHERALSRSGFVISSASRQSALNQRSKLCPDT